MRTSESLSVSAVFQVEQVVPTFKCFKPYVTGALTTVVVPAASSLMNDANKIWKNNVVPWLQNGFNLALKEQLPDLLSKILGKDNWEKIMAAVENFLEDFRKKDHMAELVQEYTDRLIKHGAPEFGVVKDTLRRLLRGLSERTLQIA